MRIGLADDDSLSRNALAEILRKDPTVEIAWSVADGEEAVAACANSGEEGSAERGATPVDVVLMDLNMRKMDGITAIRRILALPHPPRLVVLSSYATLDKIREAFRAGAVGYLAKDDDPALIVDSLRRVLAGELVFSPTCSLQMVEDLKRESPIRAAAPERNPLTPREQQVLGLIADSMSNQEIAKAMGLGLETIKGYVKSIIAKCGVQDRAGAVAYGLRHGLID